MLFLLRLFVPFCGSFWFVERVLKPRRDLVKPLVHFRLRVVLAIEQHTGAFLSVRDVVETVCFK
jgi:hypothetical protein